MTDKKLETIYLLSQIHEPLLSFFDIESDRLLDLKIEVLKQLKDGKQISEIPRFYDILELYPEEDIWDL